MLNLIDRFLNRITMYRLVLYFLIILLAIAAIFGAFGILPYDPIAVIFTAVFLTVACLIVNVALARLFNAHPNTESAYITALILALIITPGMPTDGSFVIFLSWVAVWAMASKYILAIDKKHIFNPAALAVALTALMTLGTASWWIGGNIPMMAFVVIGGLLVTRKIQRFDLVASFFAVALASDIITHASSSPLDTAQKALVHTPILFFAFIMITEPLTTPPTRGWRIAYGALVGALFAPAIHVGSIYSTPELALLVGNVFSYIVSPKGKMILALKEKIKVGGGIYDFVFSTGGRAIKFRPGQYLEWTLAHTGTDGRGNRRYFTIASAPTENELRLGVRFYEPPSSFKKRMLAMEPGDTIMAGQLAGDFTLPRDPQKRLAFIAGGIGITPFRSMIKDLVDRGEHRDIVMLYSNKDSVEIAYRNVFDEAHDLLGIKTVYALTGANTLPAGELTYTGRITAKMIKKEIPDYLVRTFYISGTQSMTSSIEKILREAGIPRAQIKIDFFPGFA